MTLFPMAQMFMPTIQTSPFMDMLTGSDEVQSSTASFIASQQLQTEANIPPTEIPLHSFSSSENPHFVQQNRGTLAVDQARFPLVSDEEITEINEIAASQNTARATKTWMAAWAEWCKARNINVNMETYCPQALDGLLNKFFVEIRKKELNHERLKQSSCRNTGSNSRRSISTVDLMKVSNLIYHHKCVLQSLNDLSCFARGKSVILGI